MLMKEAVTFRKDDGRTMLQIFQGKIKEKEINKDWSRYTVGKVDNSDFELLSV